MHTRDNTHSTIRSDSSLSTEDFQFIADYAKLNFGLNLTDAKRPLVHSRLSRRLRELGLRNFNEYRGLLNGPKASIEQTSLLSALTTNVTGFFRENHHFDTLRKDVLPPLLDRAKAGGKVRILSAGCSTGQEPYSIAMTILDVAPDAQRWDVKVIATDIDPAVVETAKAGLYSKNEILKLPSGFSSRFFSKGTDSNFTASDKLRHLIDFGVVNLIKEIPIQSPVDAIFCRNVAIYFDKETQQRTWMKFVDLLGPNGFLFIGHSERISGPADEKLRGRGITTYEKEKR